MRILAFVLSLVATMVVLTGSLLLLVLTAPRHSEALLIVATSAVTAFIYGPLLIGSFVASWGIHPSTPEGKRYVKRALGIVLGVEALAVVAIAAYAILAGAAAWLPVVFVALGAVLTIVAFLIGIVLYRYDGNHPRAGGEIGVGRAAIVTKIRTIVITFFASLVVFMILFVVLDTTSSRQGLDLASEFATAFAFACIFGGGACLIVAWPFARRMREVGNRDFGMLRKIARVVLRGKQEPLTDDEQAKAAQYASVAAVYLPFQIAYIVLLYLGIGTNALLQFARGEGDSTFSAVFPVLLVVVLVVFLPLSLRQIRRARSYARERGDRQSADV